MNWKFWEKTKKIIKDEKSMEIKTKYVFPCADDNCLVRVACTKACDKLIMNEDELRKAFLDYNVCPDCGSGKFMEGPSGGMSQNVKCVGCGHWYNLALPLFIERIHIDKQSGRFY
ncbi:hypothetical protein KAR91_65090 [Candidatus Pacearchaeota archaeon]|nr:hypothetical protein [Candidatus Pacearchaeota archaeon]